MDFIEEKIGEAMDNEFLAGRRHRGGRRRHLRNRLRENEVAQANFILVLGAMIEARYASEWWEGSAKMDRAEFEETARDLAGLGGRLTVLRRIVAGDGAALS